MNNEWMIKMANKPKKPCPSCKVALVSDGYCDKCQKQMHKKYRRSRGDKREQRFYNSAEWKKVRDYKLSINPLCEICYKEGVIKPAEIVHHKIEIKDTKNNGWSKRLDLGNLQSCCFACHNRIHSKGQGQG